MHRLEATQSGTSACKWVLIKMKSMLSFYDERKQGLERKQLLHQQHGAETTDPRVPDCSCATGESYNYWSRVKKVPLLKRMKLYELGCVWQARRTAISFDIKSSYEGAICSAEYEFCRIGILVVPLAGHVELDIER